MANYCSPETEKEIRIAAISNGVSPQFLITMANIESSCNPTAVNATTHATGLFQFLPRAAKDVHLKLSDRADAAKSANAAARYTKRNITALRHYGVPVDLNVNPEYGYLAHQQGAQGLADIINAANNNGPVTPGMRKNMDKNSGTGKTPKQFLDLWKTNYQQMANGQGLHNHKSKIHHHHSVHHHTTKSIYLILP